MQSRGCQSKPRLMNKDKQCFRDTETVKNVSDAFWITNNYRPQSWEIMHLVASVRPFVCPSVCTLLPRPASPVLGDCLCVGNQWAYADDHADAIDRLLII